VRVIRAIFPSLNSHCCGKLLPDGRKQEWIMALNRRKINSASIIAGIEALESRKLFSATLVQITIPVTTPPKVIHKAPKPKVVHKKAVKVKSTSGEEHATVGYQVFAG
jgi:hypothetical protein